VVAATDAVWIDVLPSMKGFGPALAKGADQEAGKVGKSAGTSFGKAALAATAVVASGAALATKALFNIGRTFHEVESTIRVGTGATGDALDALTKSAQNVGTRVPAEFADVGTAIADLNTRLGLTGEPLEAMAEQFLELSRITGTDVASNIASMTRVFGDWDVAAQDQAGTLDMLFRASQATGIGVDELAGKVVQFGSPLRAMGFSLEESAAMFGKFEQEGVNAELVIGSLRQGLGRMAKAGEDAPSTFRRVVDEIAGMESRTEATAAAMELFGSRAGPDMAAAIQEGRFELGELLDLVENGGETIMDAAGDTLGFSEQWQMFKNQVMVGLAPVAERVFAAVTSGMTWIRERGVPAARDFVEALRRWAPVIGGVIAVMGGLVAVVSAHAAVLAVSAAGGLASWIAQTRIAQSVTRVWTAVQWAMNAALAANPITIVVVALAALGAALVVAYKKSETFRDVVNRAWAAVRNAVGSVVNWFTGTAWPAIKGVWDGIRSGVETLRNRLRTAWEGIRLAVAVVVEALKLYWNNILKPVWSAIAAAARWLWTNGIKPYFDWIAAGWRALVDAAQWAWRTILKPVWDAVAAAARWLWDRAIRPVFGWIGDRWSDVVRGMQTVWNRTLKPVFEAVGRAVGTMRDAVGRAVDAVGRAWDGLKRAFAAPVNWVIDNVINKFLGWVNRIAKDIGVSIEFEPVARVAWGSPAPGGRTTGGVARNKGGPIPGTGADRDSVWVYATPGEHMWTRREVQAAGGHGAVEQLRRSVLAGDVDPVGGPAGWLRNVATSALDRARKFIVDAARPGFNAVMGLMDRTVGRWAMPGRIAAGVSRRTGNALLDWMAGIEEEAKARIPDLGSGYQSLINLVRAAAVPHVVTSTLRPGDPGYHGRGKAADFSVGGHLNRGYRHSGLRAIFDAFLPVQSQLAELILAGAPFNIKNGRRVPGYAWGRPGQPGNHWNHVHAAVFDRGGWLPPGVSTVANWTGRPEPVLTDGQWRDLRAAADHGGIGEAVRDALEGWSVVIDEVGVARLVERGNRTLVRRR
jgi:TP901 family phage tail tape measure protein